MCPHIAVTSALENIYHIYDIATPVDNNAFVKMIYSSGSVRRPAPCFPTCKNSTNAGENFGPSGKSYVRTFMHTAAKTLLQLR